MSQLSRKRQSISDTDETSTSKVAREDTNTENLVAGNNLISTTASSVNDPDNEQSYHDTSELTLSNIQSCNTEEPDDDITDETALSVRSAQTMEEQPRLSEEPLPVDATLDAVEVLELTSILPEKIEERVLARPYDLGQQLKVTVEKRLEQRSSEETSFKELNLELSSSYCSKLQNNASLLQDIFSPLFKKAKKPTILKFPKMRIDILNEVISKLEFLGEYQKIVVPFSISDPSTIVEHCLKFITLVQKSSPQEILLDPPANHREDYKPLKSEIEKLFGDATTPLVRYGSKKIFPKPSKKQKEETSPNNTTKQKKKEPSGATKVRPSGPSLSQKKKESSTSQSYTFDHSLQSPQLGNPSSLVITAHNYWDIGQFHSQNITGQDITVAVVDTGLDYSHPALCLKKNIELNNLTDSIDSYDNNGHSTACASIICGKSFPYSKNPAVYVEGEQQEKFPPGIAPDANLIVYKIFPDGSDTISCDVVCKALEHIASRSDIIIDVVSLSLGSLEFSLQIAKVVTKLIYNGVIVVCAASNHGHKFMQPIAFPARLGHVLCIGSHGPNGKASPFSPVGQQIDFLAPGEGITVPSNKIYQHYIANEHGTSFAAPAVVGLICLLLDYIKKNYLDLFPHFKFHWVMKELLQEMSTSPGQATDDKGFGALNPMRFFKQPKCFVERIKSQIDSQSLQYYTKENKTNSSTLDN